MFHPAIRLAAVALTAMTPLALALPASGAPVAQDAHSALRQAVLTAPHPALHVCRDAYSIEKSRWTTTPQGASVAVVQLTCRRATGSSPQEISVWRSIAGHIGLIYYLVPGGHHRVGRANLLAAGFSRHGSRITVRYLGYLRGDATCCPSRLYRQRFYLAGWTVRRGALIRIR